MKICNKFGQISFWLCVLVSSAMTFHAHHAEAEVKPYMDQLLHELFVLKPFIVNEDEFKNPKNNDTIKTSLNNMVQLSKKINHDKKIKKSAFKVSAQVLTEQLKDVSDVFQNGNKDYSLWTLKSTLNTCMSCHTQLPSVSTRFNTENESKKLTHLFNEAEFLFTVRNFDQAMPLYSEAVKNYPKDMKIGDLDKVLLRKAYYFVRVKRDLPGLVVSLTADLQNKSIPESNKKSIQDLITSAESLQADKYPEFTAKNESELKIYAEKELQPILKGDLQFLSDKNLITYLKVSSILYEYIDKNPKTKLLPDMLYWLSFCEKRYTKNMYYSLPELYLRQCIMDYPKNPVAKKCYKEFEEMTLVSYTGSSGVNLPKDVRTELEKMKKMIE